LITFSTLKTLFEEGLLYHFISHSTLIATAAFLTYPAWPPTFRAKWFITFA
jgi:hypothetical protein